MIDPAAETGSAAVIRAELKAFMRQHKITQRWLAAELGVTEKHISQVFRGHIRMTFVLADTIAAALGAALQVQVGQPDPSSPDANCVFVDVSGSLVTLTQTTGWVLHAAINGQWVLLPDRERVSVETAVEL